jgi:TubC N-terminal docking domain
MTASLIFSELQNKGIVVSLRGDKLRLEPKEALTPELLAKVKEHKATLIAHLSIPRLPWQLERLLNAASSGVLNIEMRGVRDTPRRVMALACDYLAGDNQKALSDLWEVYTSWQQNKN